MENFYTVKEAVQKYNEGCERKVHASTEKILGQAVLAGAMIGMGAAASSVAAHAVDNVGIARLVTGAVFPVGLMMVILLGAELFTGSCLITMGNAEGRISFSDVLRILGIVYIGNFVGSILLAMAICFSGQLDYSGGLLGAYTIKVAMGKIGLAPGKAVVSGILCNVLVCAAVLMAVCAKDVTGKLISSFFMIMLFATAGFEHCVANMYYITAGLFAKMNPEFMYLAMEQYGYSVEQMSTLNIGNFLMGNLLPVTIGNILGGVIIGLSLFYLNREQPVKVSEKKEEQKNEHDIIFKGNNAGVRC